MLYAVTAIFGRPIDGRASRTAETLDELIFAAQGPESAARKWLWRFTPEERSAVVKVVVFAPENANWRPDGLYQGAPIEFERREGRLQRLGEV
ncbi:MAG TPA: hypothetical protein VHZ26_16920 [Caulobacteraceae bacterium]|nr:hypothetical protein [Caulobacteraceae bacterium]